MPQRVPKLETFGFFTALKATLVKLLDVARVSTLPQSSLHITYTSHVSSYYLSGRVILKKLFISIMTDGEIQSMQNLRRDEGKARKSLF